MKSESEVGFQACGAAARPEEHVRRAIAIGADGSAIGIVEHTARSIAGEHFGLVRCRKDARIGSLEQVVRPGPGRLHRGCRHPEPVGCARMTTRIAIGGGIGINGRAASAIQMQRPVGRAYLLQDQQKGNVRRRRGEGNALVGVLRAVLNVSRRPNEAEVLVHQIEIVIVAHLPTGSDQKRL